MIVRRPPSCTGEKPTSSNIAVKPCTDPKSPGLQPSDLQPSAST